MRKILIVLLLSWLLLSCNSNNKVENKKEINDIKGESSTWITNSNTEELTKSITDFINKTMWNPKYLLEVNCNELDNEVIDFCLENQKKLKSKFNKVDLSGTWIKVWADNAFSTGITDFIDKLMKDPLYIIDVKCDSFDDETKVFCEWEKEKYNESYSKIIN